MKHAPICYTFTIRHVTDAIVRVVNERYNRRLDRVWCYDYIYGHDVDGDSFYSNLVVGVLYTKDVVFIPINDKQVHYGMRLNYSLYEDIKPMVCDSEEEVIRHFVKSCSV